MPRRKQLRDCVKQDAAIETKWRHRETDEPHGRETRRRRCEDLPAGRMVVAHWSKSTMRRGSHKDGLVVFNSLKNLRFMRFLHRPDTYRSEERRVGKECRARLS